MRSRVARRGLVAAAALGLLLGSGSAFAADEAKPDGAAAEPQNAETGKLDQAVKAIEQLNYTEAQQLLFAVVQSGHATSEQLAKAYFNIGQCEAALGNDVEATDSFYLALMIQPATIFPPGGSPKIRQRLNEARSRVTEVGVLDASAHLRDGVLDVRLRNDPLQLVKDIEVVTTRAGGDVGHAKLDGKASRVEIESDVQTIRVLFHDEAGNELKAIDVEPGAKTDGSAPAPAVEGKPSVWTHWGLWAGVAGAFAIGGTYFTIEAGKLDKQARDAAAAQPPNEPQVSNLEDRRDSTALYGIVGYSLAGAAAVTAGALLLFHDDAPKPASDAGASNTARLIPIAGPGQVGAEFSMHF
jgi:hypothetical protein